MRRILAMVTLALMAQVLVIGATSWYVGQSGGSQVATVFGQEAGQPDAGQPAGGASGLLPSGGGISIFNSGFCFACPIFTVDQCEADNHRKVTVGGKVSPDSMIGQDVYISRGGTNVKVGTVQADGTYLGSTGENYAKIGQTITVGIRPVGSSINWINPCVVVNGPPTPN